MKLPEHPYIVGCEHIWSQAQNGGLVADRLLITTNLALRSDSPEYNAESVAELEMAMIVHAQENRGHYVAFHFVEAH